MTRLFLKQPCRLAVFGLLLVGLAGCSALRPVASEQPSFYALDGERIDARIAVPLPATASKTSPTLIVNPPHAAPGFDSQRIIYIRAAHQLEYYSRSEWIDTPARMLAPLIVSAVEQSGTFRAVFPTPSAAVGDLRLDTEIVRLQHELDSKPSRVHLTLRTYIVDNTTRQVLAWREFDESVAVASEDPYGSVMAANRATHTVLKRLADFCTEVANIWHAAEKS